MSPAERALSTTWVSMRLLGTNDMLVNLISPGLGTEAKASAWSQSQSFIFYLKTGHCQMVQVGLELILLTPRLLGL